MKTTFKLKTALNVLLFSILFTTIITAQVGINTTTPQGGSMLDITSTNKGLLIPRVDIVDLSNIAPITGGNTESLLVYNTNPSTGKGFYYWSGAQWVNVSSDDWKLAGNSGTNPGTGTGQNYIGTSDSQNLVLATNSNPALTINTSQRLLANVNGANSTPTYSFASDQNVGMWRSNTDRLNLVAGGREFIELFEGSNDELRLNDGGYDINLRVETDDDQNAFFVDGNNNNIGLGTGTPNTSAQLDMADDTRGILINRVSLSATDNASPITSPATGLLVYNTATSSSGATEILPGFYYWDGSRWIAMGGTNGKDWSLDGNAGTNPSNNFIGTTDNTDFVLRTNNTERLRFANTGVAGIGAAPYTNAALRVSNSTQPFGVIGETSSNGSSIYGIQTGSGIAVRGDNSGSGFAVYGQNTGSSIGVFGVADNSHGVYGTTSYTGGAFLTAGSVGWGSGNNLANGMLAVADNNASSASNIAIRAVSGSTTSISSSQILNVAVNANATDLGLYVITEKISGVREAARFQTNYSGDSDDADARDMRAQLAGYTNASEQGGSSMYYGGYFYSGGVNSGSWAYAGARYGNTNYKIIGNGNVSTIVNGINKNDSKKIMFAPESPEVLFEDYGSGQLLNGIATISIDPIFAKNITVNNEHPLRVFIQLEGDCNGVYVTNKSASGFIVKELQSGTSDILFSWHIVANRANEEETIYADLRFPDAPVNIVPEIMIKNDINTKNPEKEIKTKEFLVQK